MKLRYRKSGNIYIPQYLTKEDEWKDFTADQISGDLRNLCEKIIVELSFPRRSRFDTSGYWYYFENDKDTGKGALIFSNEMYLTLSEVNHRRFLGLRSNERNVETRERSSFVSSTNKGGVPRPLFKI
jgi:hypothetical protein